MKEFKEIAEKCLKGELSGTFILKESSKFQSSELIRISRGAWGIKGYVNVFNSRGECFLRVWRILNRSKTLDIIDFIPDNEYLKDLNNALEIKEKEGRYPIFTIDKDNIKVKYRLIGKEDNLFVFENLLDGSIVYKTLYQASKLKYLDTPIVMKKDSITQFLEQFTRNELTIEIPDGKEVDWDESKKQNKIVFRNKQLTYDDIIEHTEIGSISNIHYFSDDQMRCLLAKNRLANVAKYLNGEWKPDISLYDIAIIILNCNGVVVVSVANGSIASNCGSIWFKTEELAHQAIEILGEETVKLALEPLGI